MLFRKSRPGAPEVNAGSMADIAFLLLIFFLVTTTIAEESGVLVRLPEWSDDQEDVILSDEAVLSVLINYENELLVEGKRAEVGDIPTLVREHIQSPGRRPDRKLVSLIHDRGTSYARYLSVYDALKVGYVQLWNEVANERFGKAYEMLSEAQQVTLRQEYPMVISEAEPSDNARG